ncbi:MAG: hypothetical protein ABI702_04245 [Burkholderiales bacterium]
MGLKLRLASSRGVLSAAAGIAPPEGPTGPTPRPVFNAAVHLSPCHACGSLNGRSTEQCWNCEALLSPIPALVEIVPDVVIGDSQGATPPANDRRDEQPPAESTIANEPGTLAFDPALVAALQLPLHGTEEVSLASTWPTAPPLSDVVDSYALTFVREQQERAAATRAHAVRATLGALAAMGVLAAVAYMELDSEPPRRPEAQTGADEARWRERSTLGSDSGWQTNANDGVDAPAPGEPKDQRPAVTPEPGPLVQVEAQHSSDSPLSDSAASKARVSRTGALRGSQRQRGKPPAAATATPEVRGVETNSRLTPSREACSATIVALGLCSTSGPAKDKP